MARLPLKKKTSPEPSLLEAERREWRILRDFPDYEISNDGRLRRATAGSNTKIGTVIRVSVSRAGYPKYILTSPEGIRLTRNAHRLVAAEFLQPPEDGSELVLHEDDNKLNCVWTNLKWGSPSDNYRDAERNGLLQIGENHPCTKKPWTRPRGEGHSSSKLSESDVMEIFRSAGRQRDIADLYGVDQALVGRIRTGKVWKHLTNPAYRKMLDDGSTNE